MAKVLDHLYISGYAFASNLTNLQECGITHIVNVAYEYPDQFPDRFTYLHIPAKDVLYERLRPEFDKIASFVSEAKGSDGKVLIHCQLGVSRSATAVLACLMINEQMNLWDAFRLLKSAKDDVEPNTTFLKDLRILEKELFGKYCKEKLTFMDKCEDIDTLDWEEYLAFIMSRAALTGAAMDSSSTEVQEVVKAFKDASEQGEDSVIDIVTNAVILGMESNPMQNDRDARARATVEQLLKMSFGNQLKDILFKVSNDASFNDLTIDVPKASTWLQELRTREQQDEGA